MSSETREMRAATAWLEHYRKCQTCIHPLTKLCPAGLLMWTEVEENNARVVATWAGK